uniref:Uncharacterized protein n=1 Tax=Panagrolaimus sp. ES5 TaxID=591445 RepID=A0AC34G6B0_9BILA
MRSNNFIQRFSSEISISFMIFMLSANAVSSEAALPVCGKILVAKMYEICQATDCNTVTPITAETYAPFVQNVTVIILKIFSRP